MANEKKNPYDRLPEVTDPRQVEAWALLQSSRALDDVRRNPDDTDSFRNSLRANMLLWGVFQSAVMEPDSPLPVEVRQNLYKLSRLVDKVTYQCLADMDIKHIDVLIDINRNIAAGLSGSPETGDTPSSDTPSEQPVPVEGFDGKA